MRFCSNCKQAGHKIGINCMCRCRDELSAREQENGELERVRENDGHDSVIIEEPDEDAASSLAAARFMVTRLRRQPLSRIIDHFSHITKAGAQNKVNLSKEKENEDRLRDNDNKLQKIIEERFETWVAKMAKPPQACKEAIRLGSTSSDYRMGLYIRAKEVVEAVLLSKANSDKQDFISTAIYPNRLRDKADLEKSRDSVKKDR